LILALPAWRTGATMIAYCRLGWFVTAIAYAVERSIDG
jgi:hypothetical protein